VRLLQRRGLLDDSQEDELTEAEPLQAALAAASVQGQLATGERAGQRVRRLLSDAAQAVRSAPLCFAARGFSLHAATRLDDDDRAGLERLIRYATRPPLAAGRLRIIDDERLTFRLKAPWSDGTTHLVLSPLELIEKLAALVPPPRLNLVRYHGVLAPNASERKQIVPSPPLTEEPGLEPADLDSPQARAHCWPEYSTWRAPSVPPAGAACASSPRSPMRSRYVTTSKASVCRRSLHRSLQLAPHLKQSSSSAPEPGPESVRRIEPLSPSGSTVHGPLRSKIKTTDPTGAPAAPRPHTSARSAVKHR